jgi:hypothetical protein
MRHFENPTEERDGTAWVVHREQEASKIGDLDGMPPLPRWAILAPLLDPISVGLTNRIQSHMLSRADLLVCTIASRCVRKCPCICIVLCFSICITVLVLPCVYFLPAPVLNTALYEYYSLVVSYIYPSRKITCS